MWHLEWKFGCGYQIFSYFSQRFILDLSDFQFWTPLLISISQLDYISLNKSIKCGSGLDRTQDCLQTNPGRPRFPVRWKCPLVGRPVERQPYRMPFPADDCWFSTDGRIRKLTTIIWTGMVVKCGGVGTGKANYQTMGKKMRQWTVDFHCFLTHILQICE